MTDRELMQQALDALEVEHSAIYGTSQTAKAIKALRARLAQPEPDDGYCQACDGNHCTAKNGCIALDNPKAQPEPEPVAWHEPGAYGNVTVYKKWAEENKWLPLYKERT